MSPLALVASLTLAIAIGISWLVLALDAPITRRKLVRQIPLPLEHPGSAPYRKSPSRLRPWTALTGSMLILLSGMSAASLGRLAIMQPSEATAVLLAYPLLKTLWSKIMGTGPIVCVVLAVPGTYCIVVGLGSKRC